MNEPTLMAIARLCRLIQTARARPTLVMQRAVGEDGRDHHDDAIASEHRA